MYSTVMSTKGQVVLPARIREEAKINAGVELLVYTIDDEIRIRKMPKDPIGEISGIAKHLDIPEDAVKQMRIKDDELRRQKLGF
ncbi:MAG: AbrB/MazE/SpoVT family DNA-binding domain-containing protein [Candidatus Diapherotrites archaeon]|uniref:AbrB/MazE/SpoVT family DNA-binding domain-containing protein n=1 Tax=Candidatus Iainarchaeum sp. TaxID=3101447 RepID=A0A7J4JWL1_9ARCH|nr:MAG: hypothetical protein QT12_C0006G0028 [archaeon GW2011_AR21]MBS3058689.1 AbrB/MazE/SpoVT family DNA-binding domain-containing protein [Candidatus Diapherotrites archaeon]HIH21864.1 AbrB/MazE/SpoVT family DNA-binding domain-containing protein [Candidatus Diapherotrites archaeon]